MNEEQRTGWSWEQRYRNGHTPWDRDAPSPALNRWLEKDAIPHGHVLVPGCGYGHEVVALCARGFAVTAVDFAQSALTELERRLGSRGLRADLVCADWFDWRPPRAFTAIYEQTSLCSLPPDRWQAYAERLAAWLEPGGLLFALFVQTGKPGGPPWHCDPITMQRLFRQPAWRWIEGPGAPIDHPALFQEIPAVLEHSRPGGGRRRGSIR